MMTWKDTLRGATMRKKNLGRFDKNVGNCLSPKKWTLGSDRNDAGGSVSKTIK